MTTLRERLEALAESGESNAWLMVQLLWPVIEAADRLDGCLAEFDEYQYCGEYFQALHDALAELEQKLNTGKGEGGDETK